MSGGTLSAFAKATVTLLWCTLGFGLRWGDFGSESTQGGSHHIVKNLIPNYPSVAQKPGVRQSSVTAALYSKL